MTKAGVHDINYLQDVKYEYHDCSIFGGRGYIGANLCSFFQHCSNSFWQKNDLPACPLDVLSSLYEQRRKLPKKKIADCTSEAIPTVHSAKTIQTRFV